MPLAARSSFAWCGFCSVGTSVTAKGCSWGSRLSPAETWISASLTTASLQFPGSAMVWYAVERQLGVSTLTRQLSVLPRDSGQRHRDTFAGLVVAEAQEHIACHVCVKPETLRGCDCRWEPRTSRRHGRPRGRVRQEAAAFSEWQPVDLGDMTPGTWKQFSLKQTHQRHVAWCVPGAEPGCTAGPWGNGFSLGSRTR